MATALSTTYTGALTNRLYAWTDFVSILTTKEGQIQYDGSNGIQYLIWFTDGPELLNCVIWQGTVPADVVAAGYSQVQNDADKAAFLTSYAPSANAEVIASVRLDATSTLPAGSNQIGAVAQGSAAALAGAWTMEITDGTHGPVAVKAASTAAIATDPALVVAISPNNSITTTEKADVTPATQNVTAQDIVSTSTTVANGQVFVTGAPTAGSAASFAISTIESIKVQVTGTWTGTLALESSVDGGTTWFSSGIHQSGTSYTINNFTANFLGGVNVSGATNFRVRATAAWTGTATVLVVETVNANSVFIGNPMKLQDATTQSTLATIKAASTAAIATDPALVVTLGPNTPLPAGTSIIGALVANQSVNLTQVGGSAIVTGGLAGSQGVGGLAASGAALVGNPVLVAGSDGTDARSLATDASGHLIVEPGNTANTTPWLASISQGGNTAVVKAASTAPVATDPALVVTLSPNSASTPITGTVTANQGTPNTTANSWPTTITDTTNGPVAVKPASTAPATTDAALVVVLSPNQQALPVTTTPVGGTPGNTFGDVTLASTTAFQIINRTTYTEQSANFTGSVVSSSASDAAAGTGARTITIFWMNAAGTTVGTESATLNGVTAVNLVTTTKCFIEKIIVATTGSGAANAGTITLWTGTGGTGTAVGTIGIGDNQTFWAHHYIVSGKTNHLTAADHGNNGTGGTNGSTAFIRAIPIPVSGSPNIQIAPPITVGGAADQVLRTYGTPIQTAGPARIAMYVTPNAATSNNYRGGLDYFDQ